MSGAKKTTKNKQPNKATRAVELAANSGAQLWHDPNGEAYADIWSDGTRRTIRVRSRVFRSWLSGLVYQSEGSALGGQAGSDAVEVLSAMAVHDGPERDIYTRLARDPEDGTIYLDLGDDSWQAIRVTADGWAVVQEPPVRFRRPRGIRPLPIPTSGGSLDDLRALLNLASDSDWILLLAWMVGALHPEGPYPVLPFSGEQGSGKTNAARMVRHMLDPNEVPVRTLPREERDLIIAGRNGLIIAIDNVSELKPWLSDAFCRLATGGGFSTRELYTDGDEAIFSAKRPIMLTGIEDVVVRGDLADRAIPVELPRIPDEARRTEQELWEEVDRVRPGVLGALLDAVALGLARIDEVEMERLPRMADFARWIVACEPALPWSEGAFLAAYDDVRSDMVQTGIEADPVAAAIRELMQSRDQWQGTATELLAALDDLREHGTKPPKTWPETPQAMGGRLTRAAPNLRRVGIEVDRNRTGSTGRRVIDIRRLTDNPDDPTDNPSGKLSASEALGHNGSDNTDNPDDFLHPRTNGDMHPDDGDYERIEREALEMGY